MEIVDKKILNLTVEQGSEPQTVLSPVAQGLMYWFDAIDNAGLGTHSNSITTWLNKGGQLTSETSRNAVKMGSPVWGSNYLELKKAGDGYATSDISPLFDLNAVTMEAVVTIPEIPSEQHSVVFGTIQAGGISIRYSGGGKFLLSVYKKTNGTMTYHDISSSVMSEYIGKKCYICARYGTDGGILYIKGDNFEETIKKDYVGALVSNSPSACMVIGYNGDINGIYEEYQYVGKIHSARCYGYVLTDEEMVQNLAYERDRYGF
jgi:hypothetical protein